MLLSIQPAAAVSAVVDWGPGQLLHGDPAGTQRQGQSPCQQCVEGPFKIIVKKVQLI